MKVIATCETCRHRHPIDFDPLLATSAFRDWSVKHAGHVEVKFLWPERTLKARFIERLQHTWRWRRRASHGLTADCLVAGLDAMSLPSYYAAFLPNADVKLAYAASTAVTITLASLAASSTLLAGRESSAIDNGASNKYLDYLLAGHYRTGSANLQAGRIVTAVVGARDDTPNWPNGFDGTDSTETVTTQGMYDAICRIASDLTTDSTQRTWPFGPISVESLFGKTPDQFVLFVSHSAHTTTNVWSSTESDHAVSRMGVYVTIA